MSKPTHIRVEFVAHGTGYAPGFGIFPASDIIIEQCADEKYRIMCSKHWGFHHEITKESALAAIKIMMEEEEPLARGTCFTCYFANDQRGAQLAMADVELRHRMEQK